jgi:IclR family transcriptional regulator, KDG regulon repressor
VTAPDSAQNDDHGDLDPGARVPDSAPTRTLEKGLYLLGLFDVDRPAWTAKELRERAGLPKATTRRLIKTLALSKWLAYDPASGRYHLGSSALRAFYLATSDAELVRVAHPYLVALGEETTETAILSVWSASGPIIVDSVPTSRMFKAYTAVGMVLPGVSSADAQVLIAFAPEETWDKLLAAPIDRRTKNTVTDPEILRERWRTVRQEGVAYDWGEWNAEAPAVGAPVFDQSGEARAAVTVVAAVERSSPEQMAGYAAAAKKTAADLSAALGYRRS